MAKLPGLGWMHCKRDLGSRIDEVAKRFGYDRSGRHPCKIELNANCYAITVLICMKYSPIKHLRSLTEAKYGGKIACRISPGWLCIFAFIVK